MTAVIQAWFSLNLTAVVLLAAAVELRTLRDAAGRGGAVSEIVLRLRVFDKHGPAVEDAYWQRALETEFLPTMDDDVLLWGTDDGPVAPVKRRWWRPDGRVCIELASVVLGGENGRDAMKDGRLQWLPMGQTGDALAEQLRNAGWERMP